jgi:hypothetical protein
VLVHGNFTAADALALSATIEAELHPAALAPGMYFQQKVCERERERVYEQAARTRIGDKGEG